MPILLKLDEIEPGMKLAANLMNQYSMLRPAGHCITDRDIASLKRLVPDAVISIKDPFLDALIDFHDDTKDYEVSRKSRQSMAKVAGKISSQLRDGVTLDAKNVAGLQQTVAEMMDYILSNPVTNAVIERTMSWDDYLQEHSSNVFYLSLLVGNTIKNYIKAERERLSAARVVKNAMDINPLATAALLHDIGMVPLTYLYSKAEPLTDEEMEKVRQHPMVGADMLPELIDPMVKLIIKSHHENNDGTGYPNQLPGDKVNIFARIIRVTDAYSSAVCDKIYKKARHPAIVLHEMLYSPVSRCYDPVVLKVFAGIVQPFPIGSKLLLSTGKWAVVVRYNDKKPFNPKVVVAYDEFGDPESPQVAGVVRELGSSPDLIVQSYAGYDMTSLQNDSYDAQLTDLDPKDMFDLHYP